MRIVVDTNVIVSRALFPHSVAGEVLKRIENHHTWLMSDATSKELATVLLRPKFARYITTDEVSGLLARVRQITETVPILHTITTCRDPKDDMFLELAVNGSAQYLISGDADLLALHPFRGVSILSPKDFLLI